jgi:hypothetical protein
VSRSPLHQHAEPSAHAATERPVPKRSARCARRARASAAPTSSHGTAARRSVVSRSTASRVAVDEPARQPLDPAENARLLADVDEAAPGPDDRPPRLGEIAAQQRLLDRGLSRRRRLRSGAAVHGRVRDEAESGRPSLATVDLALHLAHGQASAGRAVEHLGRFEVGHAQVGRADLEHLAARP